MRNLIATVVFILLIVAFRYILRPDFNDNPAMLTEFKNGILTLDTYNGEVSGPLHDVAWVDSLMSHPKIQNALIEAQKDSVAWARARDGTIKIWYESGSSIVSLNEVIKNESKTK